MRRAMYYIEEKSQEKKQTEASRNVLLRTKVTRKGTNRSIVQCSM